MACRNFCVGLRCKPSSPAHVLISRSHVSTRNRGIDQHGRPFGPCGARNERTTNAGRDVSLTARLSDVHQGLFPGIVGLPRQGDLGPNDDRFDIRLPRQHASRAQTTLRWSEAGDASAGWEYKVSGSWNQRREFAPPHAHGWGPLPDSDLSLALEEWTTFGEARHRGPHGAFGMQIEGQHVTTSGWEFLLPSHRRVRLSSMAESTLSKGTLAGETGFGLCQSRGTH